jgi:hypothetical protein
MSVAVISQKIACGRIILHINKANYVLKAIVKQKLKGAEIRPK